MRDYLIINGRNLKEFGVYAFGNGIHKFPEREVERITIPGRTGDLLIDKGRWENIDIDYSMALLDGANMDRLRAFLLSLRGYVRIESTFEPDYFRMGSFVAASEPKVHEEAATVKLTFNCKPQRWLKSGERELALTWDEWSLDRVKTDIINPTDYDALPIIEIDRQSTYTATEVITILHRVKTVNGSDEYIYSSEIRISPDVPSGTNIKIDCEAKTAYAGGTSLSDKVSIYPAGGEFPSLIANHTDYRYYGTPVFNPYTRIMYDEGDTVVKVIPRWWTL